MNSARRYAVLLAAIVIAGAVIVSLAAASTARRSAQERIAGQIRDRTVDLTPDEFRLHSPLAVGSRLRELADQWDARVRLLDGGGIVLAHSGFPGARQRETLNGREIVDASRRGFGWRVAPGDDDEHTILRLARKIDLRPRPSYLHFEIVQEDTTAARVRRVVLRGSLLFGLAALIVAILAIRRGRKPLDWVADTIDAQQDLESPIPPPDFIQTEVDRAVRGLNALRQLAVSRLAELGAERELLASIIRGMREGVLLVGSDRRVLLANRPCREIFDIDFDPASYLLAEVARDPSLIEIVESVLVGEREFGELILRPPADGRSFEVRAHRLLRGDEETDDEPEVLVLLFDISNLEQLESVRREFVANVSHELRTPLTAIRASVESMLDDEETPSGQAPFLHIVQRNADHMGLLIDDLTDLSLIETGAAELEIEFIDLGGTCRAIAERLGPVAREREIELEVVAASTASVRADRRRLEQMISNLLDNALKFTPTGGRVTLRSSADDGSARVVVEDTGEGIPSDALDRIFNRFFQVRRERSRQVRGTGLGLAIVKHLMRLHGGSVDVESELGHGATFTLTFPNARPDIRPAAD